MERFLLKLILTIVVGFFLGRIATVYEPLWRGQDETALERLGHYREETDYVLTSPFSRMGVREFGRFNSPHPTVGATIHADTNFESTYSLVDMNDDGEIDGLTWNLGPVDGDTVPPSTFAIRQYDSEHPKVVITLANFKAPMHYYVYEDLDTDGRIDTLREVKNGEFGQWRILYNGLLLPATPIAGTSSTYGVRDPDNSELIFLVTLEGGTWNRNPDRVFSLKEFAEEFGLEYQQ